MKQRRAITFEDLKPVLGIPFSRGYTNKLINEGKFPRPWKLAANKNAWWEDELRAWLEERAASEPFDEEERERRRANCRKAGRASARVRWGTKAA